MIPLLLRQNLGSAHRGGPVLILKVNQSNKISQGVPFNGARILMDEVALGDNDQISFRGDKCKYLVHLLEGSRDAEPAVAVASNAAILASGSFAVGDASSTSGDR